MPTRTTQPIHPGEILHEDFLAPLAISQEELAEGLGLDRHTVAEIIQGSRSIDVETALRLARYFSTSERFWLNLQARHDLELEKDRLGDRLEREVRVLRRHVGGNPGPLATA